MTMTGQMKTTPWVSSMVSQTLHCQLGENSQFYAPKILVLIPAWAIHLALCALCGESRQGNSSSSYPLSW